MLTLLPFLPKPTKEKNWGSSIWVEMPNREEEKSYLKANIKKITFHTRFWESWNPLVSYLMFPEIIKYNELSVVLTSSIWSISSFNSCDIQTHQKRKIVFTILQIASKGFLAMTSPTFCLDALADSEWFPNIFGPEKIIKCLLIYGSSTCTFQHFLK